jgi:hypothetical protein
MNLPVLVDDSVFNGAAFSTIQGVSDILKN